MSTFSINDRENMSIALRLARKGMLSVKSNPMVGCVIIKDDNIIAKGWHQKYGENHAEVNALNQINNNANGATIYLTLEPCSHQGKTPPCADAIVNSGAKKVIIAMLDPNPQVSGRGIEILKNAGIKVKVGLLEEQAKELNRGFIKRMVDKRPFVTCKVAMSLDGKTSMASGESKWITSDAARVDVHKLRSQNQAIMTGSGTVIADNPSMTVRLDDTTASPIRVVIDSKDIINDAKLNILSDEAPTIIFNSNNSTNNSKGKVNLTNVLTTLADKEINSVLLEAGPGLIGAMLKDKLIDEFVIYTAPIIMGSDANSFINLPIDTMDKKISLTIKDIRTIGKDIKITAAIND